MELPYPSGVATTTENDGLIVAQADAYYDQVGTWL